MSNREVLVFPTVEALTDAAAARIADCIERAVSQHHSCLLALSGGSLPPCVHQLLATAPLRTRIPWEALNIIWVDERYVPSDSPDSNYLLARQTLLDHTPIPSDQIYPVPTYHASADTAAAVYERQIQGLLAAHGGCIDIAMLGMGADGHVASLFPGHAALDAPATQHVVAVTNAPKPPPTRISLTPALLNRSANAIFLVAGDDKAAMVRTVLHGPHTPHAIPAQIIQPTSGQVIWMLDTAAAAHL